MRSEQSGEIGGRHLVTFDMFGHQMEQTEDLLEKGVVFQGKKLDEKLQSQQKTLFITVQLRNLNKKRKTDEALIQKSPNPRNLSLTSAPLQHPTDDSLFDTVVSVVVL